MYHKNIRIPYYIAFFSILTVLLMLLPLILFTLSLRGLSVDTVVQTLDSPNGTYFAQVIDSDQGAMGGATKVVVYENKQFMGKHKKIGQVYTGKYGAYATMEIHWKDDACLVINGVEYPIKCKNRPFGRKMDKKK